MSIEDSYNFRRIHDRLTTSGAVSAEQLTALHDEGYDAVINLMPDGESSVPDEARIVLEQGLDYVYTRSISKRRRARTSKRSSTRWMPDPAVRSTCIARPTTG